MWLVPSNLQLPNILSHTKHIEILKLSESFNISHVISLSLLLLSAYRHYGVFFYPVSMELGVDTDTLDKIIVWVFSKRRSSDVLTGHFCNH